MFASALVLVAMSVAVTSCKKDKDKEPEKCTCRNGSGAVVEITPQELNDMEMTCAQYLKAFSVDGYCK